MIIKKKWHPISHQQLKRWNFKDHFFFVTSFGTVSLKHVVQKLHVTATKTRIFFRAPVSRSSVAPVVRRSNLSHVLEVFPSAASERSVLQKKQWVWWEWRLRPGGRGVGGAFFRLGWRAS